MSAPDVAPASGDEADDEGDAAAGGGVGGAALAALAADLPPKRSLRLMVQVSARASALVADGENHRHGLGNHGAGNLVQRLLAVHGVLQRQARRMTGELIERSERLGRGFGHDLDVGLGDGVGDLAVDGGVVCHDDSLSTAWGWRKARGDWHRAAWFA
ncbi:hypothetical protein PT2222_100220 [Paraburkholderia tropica]